MADEIPEHVYTDAAADDMAKIFIDTLISLRPGAQTYLSMLGPDAIGSALRAAVLSAYAAGLAAATDGEWQYGRRVTSDGETWDEWPGIGTWSREYAPIAGPTPEGASVEVLRRLRIAGPVEVVPADVEEATDAEGR